MDGTLDTPELPGAASDELIAKLDRWDKALDAHWSAWRKESRELFDFYAGRQFTDDDKTAAKDKSRQLVVFNRFASIIDAVAGAEITDREKVQYFPREVGDSAVNEVLTEGADWIRDRADAEFEESEAYKDALVCGVGWTETRMDYDEEPDGQVIVDRVDPLEILADAKSRKPNFADARYIRRKKVMSREAAEEMFPKAAFVGSDERAKQSVKDDRHAYEGGDSEAPPGEDEVEIAEYQWFDLESYGRAAGPEGVVELSAEDLEARQDDPNVVISRRRRYWRCYRSGQVIVGEPEELQAAEFTFKAVTGKRDRNKGVWFGLGRLMRDPQKWANVFFGQILHIINTNAKGGVIADPAALEDVKKFEESWAKADGVTLTAPGALLNGNPGVINKPTPPYPQGLDRLMTMAVEAIQDVTGVNKEMLGMVDRQQAGVLEHQRKQAAYGILAAFFDSLRRYRKAQGRLMLKLIAFLPDDTLVRIVGDDGKGRYVPMAKSSDTAKFDVIVDEAPAGPNQKEKTFGAIVQLMPLLREAGLPPQLWAKIVKYFPLPSALTTEIAEAANEMAKQPPDPTIQAGKEADVAKTEAETEHTQAKTAEIVFGALNGGGEPDPAVG